MDVDAASTSSAIAAIKARLPAASSLQPQLDALRDTADRKLWHQLTNQLQALLASPESQPIQIELYDSFVKGLSKKLDQRRLVEIATAVAGQYEDPAQALSFLQSLLKDVDTPTTREAYLLCLCESAHFSLLQGDLPTVQSSLSKASKELEATDNIPSNVYSSFYRVSGDLAKSKADYVGYYKNSLLYLACLDITNLQKSLNKEERVNRSRDLGIAALLGETIYNFGELLMHPIILDLKDSEYSWLYELLLAFNAGSLGKFESLLPYVQQEPLLASSIDFLRPKICLMSLISLIFSLPTSSRSSIPFATISSSTHIPVSEVEHLIMKALSLSLVKGEIDEMDNVVRVHWVQPKVLDLESIKQLRERLDEWQVKVKTTGEMSVKDAGELMVQ